MNLSYFVDCALNAQENLPSLSIASNQYAQKLSDIVYRKPFLRLSPSGKVNVFGRESMCYKGLRWCNDGDIYVRVGFPPQVLEDNLRSLFTLHRQVIGCDDTKTLPLIPGALFAFLDKLSSDLLDKIHDPPTLHILMPHRLGNVYVRSKSTPPERDGARVGTPCPHIDVCDLRKDDFILILSAFYRENPSQALTLLLIAEWVVGNPTPPFSRKLSYYRNTPTLWELLHTLYPCLSKKPLLRKGGLGEQGQATCEPGALGEIIKYTPEQVYMSEILLQGVASNNLSEEGAAACAIAVLPRGCMFEPSRVDIAFSTYAHDSTSFLRMLNLIVKVRGVDISTLPTKVVGWVIKSPGLAHGDSEPRFKVKFICELLGGLSPPTLPLAMHFGKLLSVEELLQHPSYMHHLSSLDPLLPLFSLPGGGPIPKVRLCDLSFCTSGVVKSNDKYTRLHHRDHIITHNKKYNGEFMNVICNLLGWRVMLYRIPRKIPFRLRWTNYNKIPIDINAFIVPSSLCAKLSTLLHQSVVKHFEDRPGRVGLAGILNTLASYGWHLGVLSSFYTHVKILDNAKPYPSIELEKPIRVHELDLDGKIKYLSHHGVSNHTSDLKVTNLPVKTLTVPVMVVIIAETSDVESELTVDALDEKLGVTRGGLWIRKVRCATAVPAMIYS